MTKALIDIFYETFSDVLEPLHEGHRLTGLTTEFDSPIDLLVASIEIMCDCMAGCDGRISIAEAKAISKLRQLLPHADEAPASLIYRVLSKRPLDQWEPLLALARRGPPSLHALRAYDRGNGTICTQAVVDLLRVCALMVAESDGPLRSYP